MSKLRSAEKSLLTSPTVVRLRTVVSLRNQLRSLTMSKIDKSLLWSKQKFYEYSNKPHKMLVNKLKPRPFQSFPDFLRQADGTPTYCPLTMSNLFEEFYQHLYNGLQTDPNYSFTKEKFDLFFKCLQLPKLSPEHLTSLNSIVTPEELEEVVKHLPTQKFPGPDVLPYSYYKTFLPILSPHMISLFASLFKGTTPHPQFLHAHISVIPKPGKDPSIPENYRPIASLNSDYKIFTKILANRLSHIIPRLIHKDQVGFVRARHAGDNTRRTVNLIDLLNKTSRQALILRCTKILRPA